MNILESRAGSRNLRCYKVTKLDGDFLVSPENEMEAALLRSEGRIMNGGEVFNNDPKNLSLSAPPLNIPSNYGFSGWMIKDKMVLANFEKRLGARGTFLDYPIKTQPLQDDL